MANIPTDNRVKFFTGFNQELNITINHLSVNSVVSEDEKLIARIKRICDAENEIEEIENFEYIIDFLLCDNTNDLFTYINMEDKPEEETPSFMFKLKKKFISINNWSSFYSQLEPIIKKSSIELFKSCDITNDSDKNIILTEIKTFMKIIYNIKNDSNMFICS